MIFAVVIPSETHWQFIEAKAPSELYEPLGLKRGKVDHGTIATPRQTPSGIGIGIIVDEFGLFKPKEKQRYFAIGKSLFGGNGILYGFDEGGESADLQEIPVIFFMTVKGIEDAIERGQITRPYSEMNGERYWQWPDPSPFRKPS